MMVWDTHCKFCFYWIVRWNKMTGDSIEYRPYTEVSQAYPDIEVKAFQRAVRLIETDGTIYSGAGAAYRSFTYGTRWVWLWEFYRGQRWFRNLSDAVYDWIAKNRPFMLKVTHLFFGKNPERSRPYWLVYIVLIGVVVLFVWELRS